MFKLQQTPCPYKQKNVKEEFTMTKEMKEIIRMVLHAAIIAFAIAGLIYAFSYESKMEKAFESGYENAIEAAVLVSSDENGYSSSFGGELHSYTFN